MTKQPIPHPSLSLLRAFACVLLAVVGLAGCEGSSETSGAHHQESGHGEHEQHAEPDEHGEPEGLPDKVELSPEAIKKAGVEVAVVEAGSLRDNVQTTAAVKHDVNRVAHIAPMVEGQISSIRAQLGDTVEAGQTLAVMRSIALGDARSAINEAEAGVEVARQNFERQKKLVDKGIAAERSFVEAQGALKQAEARFDAAKSRLRALGVAGGSGPTYPLKSHIDGTIIEQHASVGETKGPQDELFVVADQSQVWIIGQVPEQSAHAVKQGMDAVVTLDAYPERSWKGTVDWIASTIDPKSRLLPIRVELANPDDKLKPGMFGTIHLSASDGTRRVAVVSVDAVQQLDGQSVVFVPVVSESGEHEGEFRAEAVELGAESGGQVEVVSGLKPGAKVVTSGAFDLKAAMTAAGRSAAHHH
jgi:cobalt-zinc-cadmium efflux system membrane fusion protein